MRNFDYFFGVNQNKLLNKPSRRRWLRRINAHVIVKKNKQTNKHKTTNEDVYIYIYIYIYIYVCVYKLPEMVIHASLVDK